MRKNIILTLVIFICWQLGVVAGDMVVTYPKFQSEKDKRFLEEVELLETALAKTEKEYGKYILKQSYLLMNELRYVEEVKDGKSLNVIWGSTNNQIEKDLIPIRIPISKGILGYRVFLINNGDKEKFAKIKTIDELKKLSVGQGADWGDVAVFEANGMNIVTNNKYEMLFKMLELKRCDYFSRGINEAYVELEERKTLYPEMMVEESILLYYPWPYYFFVSPKNPEIAKRLEAGFNIMIKDGSYDKIFTKYNKDSIEKANLKNRTLIKIINPKLPKDTPLDRKELWFVPKDIK